MGRTWHGERRHSRADEGFDPPTLDLTVADGIFMEEAEQKAAGGEPLHPLEFARLAEIAGSQDDLNALVRISTNMVRVTRWLTIRHIVFRLGWLVAGALAVTLVAHILEDL